MRAALPYSPSRVPWHLLAAAVILAAGIATAGYLYYWNYEQHYRAEVERQLSAVAELKTDELVDWRRERLADASTFFQNPAFSALVRRYFDNPADAEARAHLQTWLGLVRAHLLYDRIFLLDTQGVERISAPDTSEPACPQMAQDVSETLRLGRVNFLDFHRHAPDQPIRLAVLAPVLDGQDGGRAIGVLVLRIDPATYLYPYLSRWPTPSRTAETLLVRRDGNDALFLNDLRFRKNTALNLRFSLEGNKELPAVKAAMGQEGIVEGVDYRGEPVIAAVRAVPDSPWFLIARMDAAEVYAPVREQLWVTVVAVGALLIGAGAGVGFVWRRQRVRFYRERFEAAEALRESEAMYRTLAENIPQKIFIKGRDLRYVSMNENFARDLGIRPAEAVGKVDYDFFPKELADKYRADDRRIMETGRTDELDEKYIQGGKEVWVHTVKTPVRDRTGEIVGVFGIFWDITERKRMEHDLRRLAFIAQQAAEGIAVADLEGNLRFVNDAWARMHGYGSGAELVGRHLSIFHTDEQLKTDVIPFNEAVVQRGHNAGEVGHARKDGTTFPAQMMVTLLKDERGEPYGLAGFAEDITDRKRAEESLGASEQKLNAMLQSIGDHMSMMDQDLNIIWANKVAKDGFGDDIIGKKCYETYHGRKEPCQPYPCLVLKAFQDGKIHEHDTQVVDKNGQAIYFHCNASVALRNKEGKPTAVIEVSRNVTESKRAEEALEGAKQKAETARWHAETIGAVTADVSRHMKPREIAEVVIRHLSGALHTPRCSMVLRTDDADGVEVVALYRDGKPEPFGHKGPMTLAEHPHIAEAMRERQTVVVRSQERHELALRGQVAVDKPWYYIMVPIATGEDVFGTVNIAVVDPQTTYDDQDLLMVETICRHAAQALKNAAMVEDLEHAHAEMEKANQRLEELATTDDLTGLANRRGFLEAIGLETERARRYGSDFALAMIDVDGFKAINDACGHVFGDRVLVEVARALEEGTRATDVVARYGGDEIMILMPNTDARQAVNAVERMRCRIAGRVISDGQRSIEVTISAGISALDSKDRTAGPDLLIRQADEALYAAKHAGGNVTKTWNEITEDRAGEIPDESVRVKDLRREVASLSLQSKEMFVQSLWGLVRALEARDAYTKAHSANVTRYAVAIAETLDLGPEVIGVIRRAAMVHDVGKIGVPDSILRKRGPLDDHERRIMQRHVLTGVEILGQMHILDRETPIVRHHHERWEGGGYPDGIAGEAIPLGARILAIADAFDAITADRVYRKARSVSQALQVLIEESGRQFDARVVDAMVKWVLEIGRELGKESDLAVADLLQSQPAPVPA